MDISGITTIFERHKVLRIVLAVTVIFFLLMVSSHTGLLLLPIALFFFLGIPFLIYNILKNSSNTRRELTLLPNLTEEERRNLLAHPAAHFQTDSQKYSRVFNVSFVILLIPFIYLAFLFSILPAENEELARVSYIFSAILFGIVESGVGLLSFIAGYPRIHNHEYRMVEQYAMQTKTGAWKRIRNNRIWSWVIWGASASLLPLLIILYFITF
jgi:hypothetical protein